jgi:anti-sigma factor RsiW
MSPMTPENDTCASWQEAISAYLDGELPPSEEHRVHAHLRSCGACAEALIDLVPIVQALRGAPMATPTRDLWPHISAELRHDPIFLSRRLRPRVPKQFGWAVAAATLVLVGGVATLEHHPAPLGHVADIDTYWQAHALDVQDEGVPGSDTSALHAVQASYDLDP